MTRVANIRLKLSDFIETDLEDIIMSRIKTIEQKLSMKFVLYFWLDTDINLKAFYDRWKDNLSIKTIIKNDNSLKANEFIFFDIAPSDINYNSNVRFQTKYNYIEEIPMMLNQMYDVAKFTTRSQEMKPQKRNEICT
jgi:mRNA-degrading endonuclease HigB of HigAB toxin-antitoxin module